LTALEIPWLAVDPQAADRLWIPAGAALYRSANGGTRWARANSPGTAPLNTFAVGASGDLFAGAPTQIPRGPAVYSVSRSTDGGASWRTVLGYDQIDVDRILVAPSDPSTIYVTGTNFLDRTSRIYRSTDAGETWELRLGSPSPGCGTGNLVVSPSSAAVLYLALPRYNPATARCEQAVLRSDDGGGTWAPAGAGLPDLGIAALAVDAVDPDRVYAGTVGGGVWKSTDGGQSWSPAGAVLAGQSIYVLLASTVPDRVYAAAGGRVFRSDDGGTTWQSWSHGLQTPFVFSLAASPADPHRIYAATRNGVWVLTEND
jgi:photosystem II stability/assembly factor-like uncharacterized protein